MICSILLALVVRQWRNLFPYNTTSWMFLQSLCEWRDVVARAEDESTGYILPNKSLLEIGTLNIYSRFY